MLRTLSALILAALAASACGGNSSSSTPTAPSQPSAPYSQTDLRVGTGTEAVQGRRVFVNYTGWLYNPAGTDGKGQQFDTSAGRGVFAFNLGRNPAEVITGWERGVPGMRVGGLRRLVIPPELAYGSRGNGPVPPSATLVFDIELVEVQ
jgi:FKBP-type peptidyl-prolyl cis-trans isomerase FkpA